MGIPQNIKDIIDIVGAIGTPLAIIGALLGAWRMSIAKSIGVHENSKAGANAMEQINTMATNHIPHMAEDMKEVKVETKKTNDLLTELRMGQVETNTLLKAKTLQL